MPLINLEEEGWTGGLVIRAFPAVSPLEFVLVVLYLQGEILYIGEDQGAGVACHRSLAQADN